MRKSLIVASLFASLSILAGCDDVVKGVARTIVENDEKERAQQTQVQPTAQPMQPVQPVGQEQYYPVNNAGAIQQPVAVEPLPELPPKPVAQQPTEQVVRYHAQVITQYGGNVIVRNSPSKSGRKLGYLYDSEQVYVIGITNKCEVINNIEGCWVKVRDSQGLVGYSFGGYLTY